MANGKFVISLDFEIYWGVRDVVKLEDYKEHLLGVQTAIPKLLEIFSQYNVNATFATVGFLFFSSKQELINNLPKKIPKYTNTELSPYAGNFKPVGENENVDPFHFGNTLIQKIKEAGQEIGSHTFSHYYCLEKGQTREDFIADIKAAKKVALDNNIQLSSFVFPRNQYNEEYLEICKELGFTSFRGNERSKLFSSKSQGNTTFLRRPFRLLDSYINLSGQNCYTMTEMQKSDPVNIPSSRFLRPFSQGLKSLEKMRLKRITDSMTYAAKEGLTYHLWWHPHNFGINLHENFDFLERVLLHFQKLNTEYNFESNSMHQLADELRRNN
ncbi:MAG: polysaccharide deacetylase family protein [Ginsengibacter sp.]|jgi:peptidoglycan/xylan/chitin deacetylase (PgdA/CDA1 family)